MCTSGKELKSISDEEAFHRRLVDCFLIYTLIGRLALMSHRPPELYFQAGGIERTRTVTEIVYPSCGTAFTGQVSLSPRVVCLGDFRNL